MSTFHIAPRRALAGLLFAVLLPFSALGQAPFISTPPTNQSVVSGGSAAFSVVAGGAAPLSYQWLRFGVAVPGSASTLIVTNVTPDVGGLYSVVVSNSAGAVTSAPALLAVDEGKTFRILQLQTNGAIALEQSGPTGDDRGGLVVSPNFVFLTGDASTARFSALDLSGGLGLGIVYDGMCANLRDERLYLLGDGANIIQNGGGTITTLLELDGNTGQTNGSFISLSTSIPFNSYGVGIFSGYDRIVLWDGFFAYDISLPSGQVTFLGAVPNINHQYSESWAFWGLAEYFGNSIYLDYVETPQVYPATNIARIRVALDSVATPLQRFSNLSDMASFGFSVSRSRWYFHYEGTGQFRSGDETLGSAKAIYSTSTAFPTIYRHPISQTVYPSNTVRFDVTVFGAGPLTYQWRFNGANLSGQTNATLTLTNVQPSATGNYSVIVSNGLGGASSDNGFLFVISTPQILADPQPRSVLAGTNTSFDVTILAAPPVFYFWRRDGTNIPGGTNATYYIPFVTTSDAGDYSVIVSNRYGNATSGPAPLVIVVESPFSFKILSLSNDAFLVEHQQVTGDDRGGIAVSSNKVFVTGDSATGIFAASDLSGGTALTPNYYDALASDLRSETVFTLGDGPNALGYGGGYVSSLIEIDRDTGALTTNRIDLSVPFYAGYGSGIFAGYGQVVIHNGSHVFSIAVPSGKVTDLGAMNAPFYQTPESWAGAWGIAENFGGSVYLVYVQSPQTIVRTRVPDGATTSIQNFVDLADMASISASVRRGRWYFHHQHVSQFGGTNETVGFCTAQFSVTANSVVDHFSWSVPVAAFSGVPFTAVITARGLEDNVATNFSGPVALSAFTTAEGLPVSVTPSSSGNFVSGSWTGLVSIAQPAAGVSLRAIDFGGRFGVSSPIAISTTNDLALQVIPSTNAATLYAALTYNLILTNTGPTVSSGVFASNTLPVNVNFVSALPSQGSCAVNAGKVVCDVGTMLPGTGVNIAITVVPNALGTMTNVARVVRFENEEHPENNTNTTVIPVALPAISITDSSVNEGNTSPTRGTNIFIVSLNTTSPVPVSVNYATVTNTALDNTSSTIDYFAKFGTLTFSPGMTTTSIVVFCNADRLYEFNETFFVNLSAPMNATLARAQAIGTIINDDAAPGVLVTNAFVTEGNVGTTFVTIPISISALAGIPISFDYATSNGTAVAGLDYIAQSGQVTIAPGTTNASIILSVIGDTKGESNETFYVNWIGAANLTYSTQIVVTIVNDDTANTLDHFTWSSIGPTQLLNTPFTATLTAKDFLDRTVSNYNSSTLFSVGSGSVQKEHIIGDVNTTLSFNGGPYTIGFEFTPTTTIYVTHFRHYSGTKVSIWSDTGVLLATHAVNSVNGTWVETPLNTPLQLLAGKTYRIGGFNGVDTNPWYYGPTLPAMFRDGTVGHGYYSFDDAYPITDLGSSLYLVDLSYVLSLDAFPMTPTNVALTNGVWSGPVRVLAPGNQLQLFVNETNSQISAASNPFDVLPTEDLDLRITPAANPAPASENLVYSIVVSNTGPSSSTGVFVTNQLPPNATYISSSTDHGSITLSAGKIVVDVGTLASGEAALTSVAVLPNGVGTLTNIAIARRNEPEIYLGNNRQTNLVSVITLGLSVYDAAVREGDSGATNLVFNVGLSAASTQTVSIAYSTFDSSATAGVDYQATNGLLIFPPGVTNRTVTVPVFGDLLYELSETFLVILESPTNAALTQGFASGTIINDDPIPLISVNDITVLEGRNGFTPATFTLSLSQVSGRPVNVFVSTTDGSALAASDYVSTNTLVTFLPGQATLPFTVFVRGDGIVESDETFFLNLSSPSEATIAVDQGRATVVNDDAGAGALDHFEWSAIPSPQTTGRVFNVTISARDGLGALVPFSGAVSLTAFSGTNLIALAPTNSAPFVNSLWTGALTLLGTGTNVVISADDGAGHIGASNPFDVNVADVAITGTTPPEVLIGSPFNYSLTVSNRGPNNATAVSVTNVLSADVSFVSASSSAGACSLAGGGVVCELGALTNGGSANIVMMLAPLRGGFLTNLVSVTAFEADFAPGNNTTTNIVVITGDDDHDALPDSWEGLHGLSSANPNDANQDADGDGATNLEEYIAGTDPQNPASVLKMFASIQNGIVHLRFQTVIDKRYVVERAPSPAGPWMPFGNEILGDGDEASVSDTVTSIPQFSRVRVVR